MSIFTKSEESAGGTTDTVRRESPSPSVTTGSKSSNEVSIVARGVQVDGNVNVNGDVRIGGRINGTVTVDDRLVLASEGVIIGDVEAGEADVAGKIEGDVHATERLIVRGTASILGGIIAEHLVVEDGAAISGTCKVGKPARIENIDKKKDGVGDGATKGAPTMLPLD